MASQSPSVRMEFAVQMSCRDCEEQVKKALNVEGVDSVYIDVANELVLVNTTLPSSQVTHILQGTGKLVMFRGIGGVTSDTPTSQQSHHGAAVAIMKGVGGVKGMARLVQISEDKCVVDGTIDGLKPGHAHTVQIHEYGDLSSGCDNCGDVLGMITASAKTNGNTETSPPSSDGFLCSIVPDESGRAVFQATSDRVRVMNIIGRSMVVSGSIPALPKDRIMCGIVARSAGLFQNNKKVCTCDGVTIWDEARKNKT